MNKLITILLFAYCTTVYAQREQNNWYFGNYCAISFDAVQAKVKFDNLNRCNGRSTTMSDPVTGRLLFYSDGKAVWNNLHLAMPNGNRLSTFGFGYVIAFPFPGHSDQYFLFFIGDNGLKYVIIDMTQNSGTGAVTTGNYISETNAGSFAVTKHQYKDAYWLIAHEKVGTRFNTYLIDESGVSGQPVSSDIGMELGENIYLTMASSNKGNKLVMSDARIDKLQVFDFDRACGVVSRAVDLALQSPGITSGIAFSPDDSKLYISYTTTPVQNTDNKIIQYYGIDYQSLYEVSSEPGSFHSLRLGPDNNIYISNEEFWSLGDRVDVILNPNRQGGSCAYKRSFLSLEDASNAGRVPKYGLPLFASGRNLTTPIRDSMFNYVGSCLGHPVQFSFNITNPYDSLLWTFGDSSNEQSRLVNPVHIYKARGRYPVTVTIFRCGKVFPLTDTAFIDTFPVISFPRDTNVCISQAVTLTGPVAQDYQWSTGENTRSITRKATGITWLKASNGNCSNTDSVIIDHYPDIITELRPEYYLCEDDNELVKLDAGEGFIYYKWLPAGDTTQWVIVENTGDYFVKVTDNHGCLGRGDTKVKRMCGIFVHFPNAFTPNGDGVNDMYMALGTDVLSFSIRIYNRWGQLVFTSNQLNQGWDGTYNGKPSADGIYTYVSDYTGYKQKILHNFSVKGSFTMLH